MRKLTLIIVTALLAMGARCYPAVSLKPPPKMRTSRPPA